VKPTSISRGLITLLLRGGLIAALFLAGWFIYSRLPHEVTKNQPVTSGETVLQIILRQPDRTGAEAHDISIELYPVDIVAVRHEYFTERRAGKRFDDFLRERMKGRNPVTARLDQAGQTTVVISPGNWWLHATLPGEEDLEWRLPVNVGGRKQTIELTAQNVYTRTKSF
jgi:hypothetical protein